MQHPILLVPGIHNSGPTHWQSLWQAHHPNVERIEQDDWDHPVCDTWADTIDAAVRRCARPPLVVAHSLGCLALARWAERSGQTVRALMLVAVPDPAGPNFPAQAQGFKPLARSLGERRTVLVSSNDDPYSTPAYSEERARQWKAEHLSVGTKGHINADSGLGEWPWGWALAQGLLA